MSTNFKFEEAKNKIILKAQNEAARHLLANYGSVHLVGEPNVELTSTIDSSSSAILFNGRITVLAEEGLLNQVGVNMTINNNDIEVESEDIQANVTEALNAQQEAPVVKASLSDFKLTDTGDKYLKVSHPALENAELGLVGKSEFSASPDKSVLLQTIVKDAMTRVANETTISFTGEFKEPVIELEAKTPKEELAEIYMGKSLEEIDENNKIVEKQLKEKKSSWLTADMMSEDTEPYADSEQIEENEKYVLWQTPYADHTTYWVSDKEGYELAAFYTIEEARNAMVTGEGLQMEEEASVSVKEDMPRASMPDHLAQAAQLEEQVINASNEKIKTQAVNALVNMLHQAGYGTAKVREVTASSTGYDIMVTVDADATLKAVNIPVEVNENNITLPKKSLVATLVNSGLDINARLSEEFSKTVLARIEAEEARIQYEQNEANEILAERPTVIKTANESRNTMFEGDTDTLTLQKHLLPNHENLKLHDQISDGADSWEIVNMNAQQNSKGENDSSEWTLKKCKKPEADKEPKGKMEL